MPYKDPKYTQNFMKNAYHRIPLDIKKDEYESMVSHAKKKGFAKINAYIKDLIRKDMESDDHKGQGHA